MLKVSLFYLMKHLDCLVQLENHLSREVKGESYHEFDVLSTEKHPDTIQW